MKKLILSALLVLSCGVLRAEDTDMYLFWMISDSATFKDAGGQAASVDLSGYSARLADQSGTYLNLYDSAQDSTPSQSYAASEIKGWDIAAGVGDYGVGSSFVVELFNDSGTAYKSDVMSYSNLGAYMSAMQGMANPVGDAFAVSSFTAVPEPTSGLLLLLGVAGLALRRKKMQKA